MTGNQWEDKWTSAPSIPHETNFHRTAQSSGKGSWQSGDRGASAYSISWLGDEVRNRPKRPASTKEQGSEAGRGFQQLPAAGEKFLLEMVAVGGKRT